MLKEVLTVSALIAVVLLVRAIFKNRVPKRMLYALWLVVLLKLCLPGTLVSLPVRQRTRQFRRRAQSGPCRLHR
jgi:beta-lactamase regulating signal transducer with metallopeptidase domain